MSRETPNKQFAEGSTKTQGFLSGLGEQVRVEASANLKRVLNILKEWDREASEGTSGGTGADAVDGEQ